VGTCRSLNMNAASVEPNLKHSFLPVLKKSPASIARANTSSDCFPFLPSPGIQESQPNRDLVPAELRAEACAANRDAFRCLRLSLTKRPAPIRPVSLMSRIRIRPLKTEKEFRACEEIQREVWGASAISAELLSVMQKYGGAVLGAMAAGEMAGFLCAFLAKRKGKLIHWSHMMAVRPRFRDRGLGFRMKLLHRQLARDQGLRAICWTFDPLQSRNAKLNVGRLGVQIEEYIPDCYGKFPSRIEKGLPSDRFVACWNIASAEVERRLRQRSEGGIDLSWPRVNETRRAPRHFLKNHRIAWNLSAPRLLVEIPDDTDAMRERDLRLAKRWRMETRRIFQHYFDRGYEVEDFVTVPEGEEGTCFYVLSRERRGQ